MAQQTIGLGSVADDGTGDTLRAGAGKINANFTELYAATASGARAYKTTGLTGINATGGFTVPWDAEYFDAGGHHDTGSNTERLTVVVEGDYSLANLVGIQNLAASHYVRLGINHYNSADVFQSVVAGNTGTQPASGPTSTIFISAASGPVHCDAGDYFIVVLLSGDTSIDMVSNHSHFSIQRVA